MDAAKKVFEPENTKELLRGWLLHAHKGRDRHDEAARHFETFRYLLGVPTSILSTVAGASVLASWGKEPPGSIVVGLLGIAAGVLAALQTFLEYASRAERHRHVGVKYKSFIRELEQALTAGEVHKDPKHPSFGELRNRLDNVEETAPVVASSIYSRVEKKYAEVSFVASALKL